MVSIIIAIAIIYFLYEYVIIIPLEKYLKLEIRMIIFSFIVCIIAIILISYIKKLKQFSILGEEKIYKEVDENLEKVFGEFNLYITKNYIICIGPFNMFAVPINSIDAIDIYTDSRFYYRKRGDKSNHEFLSFLKASILSRLTFGEDNNIYVFNVICDKKVYSITTAQNFQKSKIKRIEEAAEYICEKK